MSIMKLFAMYFDNKNLLKYIPIVESFAIGSYIKIICNTLVILK